MINKKSWEEFRQTGLLMFVNQFLHIFGWAIVLEFNEEEEIVNVFPARVKFRGFSNDTQTRNFIKLSEYMKNNADELLKESKE